MMFGTSIRQRRLLRRMAGYVIEPAKAKVRKRLGHDQTHVIAGHDVVLPPGHHLPWYQRRDPTYDRYAEGLIRALCAGRQVTVVDLGANVGDTAVAVLGSDPDVHVVCVEGNREFTTYLRRNTRAFGDRVTVVEAFVGSPTLGRSYVSHGTSGAFSASTPQDTDTQDTDTQAQIPWCAPGDLLAAIPAQREVIWKSDIDGFDIHVLADHWATITGRCGVLWFEFDPAHTLGDPADVERLITAVASSGRHVLVYDNLGRRMLESGHPTTIRETLTGLTAWTRQQVEGHTSVPYVDVWAIDPGWAQALTART